MKAGSALPSRRTAFLIFLLGFAFRLAAGLALPEDRVLFPDSREYIRVADNFRNGDGLILDENAKAKRPPVYPIFLAVLRAGFGESNLVVQAAHAFLGGLSCVLLLLFCVPLLGPKAGVAGSIALAVAPLQLATSAAILVEPLFTFLLLLELFLLHRALVARKFGWAVAAGLTAGAATLLQAGHVLFFLFVLPFVFRRGPVLLVYAGCALLFPALWAARNLVVLERMVPLTTHSGYTLYESFGPGATGGTFGSRMYFPKRGDLGEVDYDALLRSRAWAAARKSPVRSAGLALEKQRRFWNIVPNHAEFKSTIGTLVTLTFAPILLFFLYGLWQARRLGRDVLWFLAPVLYFSLLHMIFLGSIRYRLPIEPFIMAVAAWAAVDLWQRKTAPGKS